MGFSERERLGMGDGTLFTMTGLDLYGLIHATAAAAGVKTRETESPLAAADGANAWLEAHPESISEHLATATGNDPRHDLCQCGHQRQTHNEQGCHYTISSTEMCKCPGFRDS